MANGGYVSGVWMWRQRRWRMGLYRLAGYILKYDGCVVRRPNKIASFWFTPRHNAIVIRQYRYHTDKHTNTKYRPPHLWGPSRACNHFVKDSFISTDFPFYLVRPCHIVYMLHVTTEDKTKPIAYSFPTPELMHTNAPQAHIDKETRVQMPSDQRQQGNVQTVEKCVYCIERAMPDANWFTKWNTKSFIVSKTAINLIVLRSIDFGEVKKRIPFEMLRLSGGIISCHVCCMHARTHTNIYGWGGCACVRNHLIQFNGSFCINPYGSCERDFIFKFALKTEVDFIFMCMAVQCYWQVTNMKRFFIRLRSTVFLCFVVDETGMAWHTVRSKSQKQ